MKIGAGLKAAMMMMAVQAGLLTQRILAKQFRTGTPPRPRRKARRQDGPGTPATIRMLMPSNRKGFEPQITPNLKAHGWYRRLHQLTTPFQTV